MRLFNRHNLLLTAIGKLAEKEVYSRTVLVKVMFLLKYEYSVGEEVNGFYSFYPYQYGPFSQKLFSDLRQLHHANLITENETALTEEGSQYLRTHNNIFNTQLNLILARFPRNKDILDYVYAKYPQFTINSKLTKRLVPEKEPGFFTIGYEKKDIDEFLRILIENKIDILIDVRKNPFSMNFSYVKSKLKEYLEKIGIEYFHIPELGVESKDRKNLKSREDYNALFEKYRKEIPFKEEAIKKIIGLGQNKRIVLLCFEKKHTSCHRGVIGDYLQKREFKVINL